MTSVHVMPVDDLIQHDDSPECVCQPECEPVEREDGSFGWLYSHHSLDGREQREGSSPATSSEWSEALVVRGST